jgi:CO/xanthine dehydrogenase FAD-binding subunit
MDLNTVAEVARPRTRDEAPTWREGDAWLAGGTWLFSEPQPNLRRLIDLERLRWQPLIVSEQGLAIAATCTIAQLHALQTPPSWTAAPLLRQCCRSFLSSFKIWNFATVGGNICMSLPAGPMISLTVALEGVCTIWLKGGGERRVPVEEFVTGPQQNILRPGDLLRSIDLPASALCKRSSFRRMALTHLTVLGVADRDPVSAHGHLFLDRVGRDRPASALQFPPSARRRAVAGRTVRAHSKWALLRRCSQGAGVSQAHDPLFRRRNPPRAWSR